MCLTSEAFVLFLNLIGSDIVTAEPGMFTVNATEGPVQWVSVSDMWCTDAVAGEHAARLDLDKT